MSLGLECRIVLGPGTLALAMGIMAGSGVPGLRVVFLLPSTIVWCRQQGFVLVSRSWWLVGWRPWVYEEAKAFHRRKFSGS